MLLTVGAMVVLISCIGVHFVTMKSICTYFVRVLAITSVSGVFNGTLATENSEISKFSGVGF